MELENNTLLEKEKYHRPQTTNNMGSMLVFPGCRSRFLSLNIVIILVVTGLSVDPTQSVDGQNPALVVILKQNTTWTMGYSLTTLLPELHTFQEVSHFSMIFSAHKNGWPLKHAIF